MKLLVDWLLERRYAVIALAVVFAPYLSFVSAAVIALQTAHRGPVVAIGDALIAALAVTSLALFTGVGGAVTTAGVIALGVGLALGGLMRALGSMNLSVQVVLLFAYGAVLLYTLFGSVDNALFRETMTQVTAILDERGLAASEIEELRANPLRLVGFYAISALTDLILVLVTAYWALSLARGDRLFGERFRELRIGFVLGVPGAIIVGAMFVIDHALIHNLLAVAACGFLLQGLALVHSRAHTDQWHRLYLVPVYLFGVPALIVATVAGVLGIDLV